jgi:4'-phosphopantetheinyl transferase EntD
MNGPDIAMVLDAFRALLPVGVAVSGGRIGAAQGPLLGAERDAARRMVPARRAEFTAGRTHARLALGILGGQSVALPVGPGRAPQWPIGTIGSISHAEGLAVAAVAPVERVALLGIDLEGDAPLDADLVTRICRPEEQRRLAQVTAPRELARLLFSAKESVYKCLGPATGIFLDFDALEIEATAAGNCRIVGHGPAAGMPEQFGLRLAYARAGGCWISACWALPTAPPVVDTALRSSARRSTPDRRSGPR